MGTMANELSLGCDCLGQIHYLVSHQASPSPSPSPSPMNSNLPPLSQSGAYTGHDGSAVVIKNVICIHEEDAGLLWKHTDYRTGGRSHSVRSRRLVVSMVCTLANYGMSICCYCCRAPLISNPSQSTSGTICSTRTAPSSSRSASLGYYRPMSLGQTNSLLMGSRSHPASPHKIISTSFLSGWTP